MVARAVLLDGKSIADEDRNMPRLTKTLVEKSNAPVSGAKYLWDDKVSGFGVKVLASGKRKYVLKYRTAGGRSGRQRWLSIGAHGSVTCEQARTAAQSALVEVMKGNDPQADRKMVAEQHLLSDVWDRFALDHLSLKKPATRRDYQANWGDKIAPFLGRQRVVEITRSDADTFHKRMQRTPYRANRVLALLSHLMNLAELWGWRDQGTNPCKSISKFSEKPRQRFLSQDEVHHLFEVLDGLALEGKISRTQGNVVKLLLLTGARSGELMSARWEWIDWNRHTIQVPDSKSGEKEIYLSDAANAVLLDQQVEASGSDYIFPANSERGHIVNLRAPWLRICKAAGFTGVRIHDLRHTAASLALAQGVSLPIIGKLLGHTQAQTTLRYAHLEANPAHAAASLIGDAMAPKK